MEGVMVNTSDFKPRRELVVAIWKTATPEDVYLWLHWNCWTVWLLET